MSVDGTIEIAARSEPEDSDGRRRRSRDSRARIVAAMLDLVREGDVAPVAEQVAERAGVGLRTVFRHFNEMESLYREMFDVIEAELLQVVVRPFKARGLARRMLELVERRAGAFERIAPFKRAATAHRHHSRFLSAHQTRLAVQGREIVRRELPPEMLADATKLEILDLMLSYEAWSRLRHEQGLTPKRAIAVLEAAIERVLEV